MHTHTQYPTLAWPEQTRLLSHAVANNSRWWQHVIYPDQELTTHAVQATVGFAGLPVLDFTSVAQHQIQAGLHCSCSSTQLAWLNLKQHRLIAQQP